jgi:chemotaxis protein MotA
MILDGGSPAELFSAPQAILLTIGGAIIASVISYPLKSVKLIPKWIKVAFISKNEQPFEVIELLTRMADKARREGLLALEEESKKIADNFLRTGVMMVVDGTDPAQVRGILEIEIYHMQERHAQGINFFSACGGYGPTMGIIGTVMGLISVLQELDNPGELGHSIAVAFLATLWGILSANMVWLPLAGKLRAKSEAEVAFRRLLLEGVLAIQAGENPRVVRDKLLAFLPPGERKAQVQGDKAEAGAERGAGKQNAGAEA